MKKVAVLAAGFAANQSEITETISLLIALSEFNAQVQIFAVNTDYPLRHHNILSLNQLNPADFDALVLPGGRGAGEMLSTWIKDKEKMTVLPLVEKIISAFHEDSKPIGAVCLAPIVVAKVLAKQHPNITLGNDFPEESLLKKWGIILENCPSTDFITDRNTKIITTPAYMNDDVTPFQVFTGIRSLAKELVEMA